MNLLENYSMDRFNKLRSIILSDPKSEDYTLSSKNFMRKFKKFIGFSPKTRIYDWLYYTGALEITVSSEFSKKNNQVSLRITQRNLLSHNLAKKVDLEHKMINNTLTKSNLYSKEYMKMFDDDQTNEAYEFELQRYAKRLFNGNVSLCFYETDGTTVIPAQHNLEFKSTSP